MNAIPQGGAEIHPTVSTEAESGEYIYSELFTISLLIRLRISQGCIKERLGGRDKSLHGNSHIMN